MSLEVANLLNINQKKSSALFPAVSMILINVLYRSIAMDESHTTVDTATLDSDIEIA